MTSTVGVNVNDDAVKVVMSCGTLKGLLIACKLNCVGYLFCILRSVLAAKNRTVRFFSTNVTHLMVTPANNVVDSPASMPPLHSSTPWFITFGNGDVGSVVKRAILLP